MKRESLMQLDVSSDPASLPEVRRRVRAWVAGQGWSEQQVGEVVLAMDEAVTNVIRHAYAGETTHRIVIRGEVVEDPAAGEGIEIRVRDFGKQVDPAAICGRDLNDVRPGGLGVHIIRAMNSTVEYRRAEGGGMLLIMRKYRTHTAECGGRPAERT